MALSQVQCLDDNHVNPRTHESKPEFLYCEDQRLALEAFLRDGREAFGKYLCARGLRGFLSDPELETLADLVEPYDPGSELFFPENAEDDEPPLSLHYWPELSDTSVPQMDLSWPDNVSYRGVTRTTVYTQPPLEGQVHIKEVVRKMIAQAQKVIAVVMDVFTDVDIFRDLLDAGFKRKVSVYILLERTTLPHFQSMCQRANMHAGHLKNLRVRCTDGADFCSRSCTKVRGRMGHRFMFIDGDKAVSGSYSFTWMSSRLDRNLITVVTGQAVEAFDRLFCVLYATSSAVDLRQVATEPEPEPEPVPAPVPVADTSAAIARRMYSPRYAMLALSSPAPSADPKETQDPQDSKNPETKKGRRKASKEPVQEDPPLHPGLTNLEKVCMMSYLPTWPEPDPASDVIGFINIRDSKKTNQNHLQRSEMFDSQAIRFSSPFSMPKEILPEVAELRQITPQHGAANKVQPAQTKAEEAAVVGGANPAQLTAVPVKASKAEATGPKPPGSGPKWDSDATETLNAENTRRSNAPTDQDAGRPSPSTTPLPGPNAEREAQRGALQAEAEPRSSCDVTASARSPTANSPSSTSTSVSSLSENSHASATTSRTASASSPSSSSSIPPLPSSSATPNPPLTSSSASESSTPPPPVPKPRTVQLIMKGGVGAGEGQKLPEFSVLTKPGASTGVLDEPEAARKDAGGPLEIGTCREADGRHQGAAAGDKMSDVLITEAPKAESLNIQEIIPTDVEHKTLMPTDCESTPRIERVVTAPGRDPTGCQSPAEPNGKRESASESKTYLARAHVAQRISYSELTLKDTHASEVVDSLKAPVSCSDASKHGEDPQGRPGFAPNAVKIPKAHAPERPGRLHLSDAPVPDFRTPTPDRESRLLSALARTPTPDGFLPRTPTPDSRTHTPDFRTPTSDGYISPRTDSTNSEEYYECNDSFHELLFDRAFLRNPGTEDYIGFTPGSNPNASTSGVKDRSAFGSEAESSSGLLSVSSLSSLKGKMAENGGGADERGESVEEGGYQRGSEDAKRRADQFKQAEDPTGTEEQNKEALKRKRGLSQSAAEKPVDAGEPANEKTAPRRVSTGDLQPGKSSSERKRPDKEKAAARGALGPSGVERRDTEGQKLLHALPKSPRDREASSPSRPPRPPRPLSITQALAPRPWVSRQPNQAESTGLHDSVRSPERTSSPRRPPSRAASPGTAGRKQDDAAHSQRGPVSPSQGRMRAGPSQTQQPFPKPEASQSQEEEAHWQEEGKSPFSLTVSRLYSLKGLKALKDKVSKGGGASSPAAGRKSTS